VGGQVSGVRADSRAPAGACNGIGTWSSCSCTRLPHTHTRTPHTRARPLPGTCLTRTGWQ
jgi:hypothetical protein